MEGCDTTRECFNAEVIEGELVAHDGSEDMSSSGGTEGTPIGLQQAGKDVDEVVAEEHTPCRQSTAVSDLDRVSASRERYRAEAIRLQARVRDLTVRQEQVAEQAKAKDEALHDRDKQITQMQRTIENLRCEKLAAKLDAEKVRQQASSTRCRLMKHNGNLVEYSAKLRSIIQELQAQLKVSNASIKAIQDAAEDLSLTARNSVIPSKVVDELVTSLPPSPSPSLDDDNGDDDEGDQPMEHQGGEPGRESSASSKRAVINETDSSDAPNKRVKQEEFEGYLADIDVAKKMITVAFQDNIWAPKTVPMSEARLVPSLMSKARTSAHDYKPIVGDTVEVRSPATPHAPASWWTGEIVSIRAEEFFYVKHADLHEPIIVERGNLRRPVGPLEDGTDSVGSSSPTNLADLNSESVKFPKVLGEWVMSDDGRGCLNQVAIKSGLVKATPRADPKSGPSVTLVGRQRDIHRAKLLLDVHVKHQKEIQGFHDKRQAMLEAMSSRREKLESQESTSFNIGAELVGVMIGKNGAHISRVIKDYGVEVNVADKGTAKDPQTRKVVIYGPTVGAVNKARAELEYLIERYPIPQNCIGWVIGRRFATLHEIADSANLNYAKLEDTSHSPCLVLCGRRQDLDDAKLLLDSHLQYHDVFEDMAKESRQLGDEFYRLSDRPISRRGGKGKGKQRHCRSKSGEVDGKGRSRGSSDSTNSTGGGRPSRPERRKGSSGGSRNAESMGKKWAQVKKEGAPVIAS
ncbi:conserved hypothetical protein [Perkinsus marinus ATCC 50983]|uniref:Agenet-like domain-containing protein n=1 Tax=Perkinsus marinus (strain ATCC 50983 / TXsc) TaxID=423536 RepID=C5K7S0_PERM5|nr:conserved hypothetical protein [Perkinsus marinus ATCC 50983]EER19605.1 conserved hypothetical protein [Perkinsus marinus ATCC 50983]|eukprot:XP_002787809.1 conserved hypothetical protein [Perkinsus marinus ATCC 50983]